MYANTLWIPLNVVQVSTPYDICNDYRIYWSNFQTRRKHSSKVYVGIRQNSLFKVSETGSSIQMTVFRTSEV